MEQCELDHDLSEVWNSVSAPVELTTSSTRWLTHTTNCARDEDDYPHSMVDYVRVRVGVRVSYVRILHSDT